MAVDMKHFQIARTLLRGNLASGKINFDLQHLHAGTRHRPQFYVKTGGGLVFFALIDEYRG